MAKEGNRTSYVVDYIRKNQRQFMLKVSRIYEPEIIEWLESKDNYNKYLTELVRADMEKAKGAESNGKDT